MHHHINVEKPYLPSYLSMRESKPFVDLVNEYKGTHRESFPQVFMVDGNGRLHDREAGSATAFGFYADVPSIGISKEYYPLARTESTGCGAGSTSFRSSQKGFRDRLRDLSLVRGDWIAVLDSNRKALGAVRTALASPASYLHACKALISSNSCIRPIFVSSGHRVGLKTALQVALACVKNGKLPEPVRMADLLSRRELRRKNCTVGS